MASRLATKTTLAGTPLANHWPFLQRLVVSVTAGLAAIQ